MLGTVISVAASLSLLFFGEPIMVLFKPETAEVTEIGARMLRFMGMTIPVLGYSTFVNQLYQSLGYVKGATVLASCRQGICFVPLIMLLPLWLGLDGILLTQALSDLATFCISVPFNVWFLRRVLAEGGLCEQRAARR